MTTDPNTQARTQFPPLLRLSQARELARLYGISPNAFRTLVEQPGFAGRRTIVGSRSHYLRDHLITMFQ